MTLAQKTVVVIGGTSGFGKATALSAAELGAKVTITGRDRAKLDAVIAEMGAAGHAVSGAVLDAADPASISSFFDQIAQFDHLVSMAGGFMGGGFLSADYETIHHAVEEKLFANLRIARAAAPKIAQGGSMTFTAGSGGRPQGASGAIVGNESISTMVRGLAVELAPKARVNAVSPTWTVTPLWRGMSEAEVAQTKQHFSDLIPLGRTAEIAEVSSAYLFLMQNGFITGQTLAVDGGVDLVG
ncbi:SDR family oxidoreductase (plasmid) [Thioclava litoralis]|uniref:SDR family oxidoreductase n=1 Tax=Thioclava litoralis TaxID=3076557 RepID=A0ABZ1E295_9RHOB|nr:SDR family oxidoreductase [Thioclava sp. FTW29]